MERGGKERLNRLEARGKKGPSSERVRVKYPGVEMLGQQLIQARRSRRKYRKVNRVSGPGSCETITGSRGILDRGAERVLARIRDVQEAVFVLVFFVNGAHQSGRRWQDFVDKDEDGLLGLQFDALANDVDELVRSKGGTERVRNEVGPGNRGCSQRGGQ